MAATLSMRSVSRPTARRWPPPAGTRPAMSQPRVRAPSSSGMFRRFPWSEASGAPVASLLDQVGGNQADIATRTTDHRHDHLSGRQGDGLADPKGAVTPAFRA